MQMSNTEQTPLCLHTAAVHYCLGSHFVTRKVEEASACRTFLVANISAELLTLPTSQLPVSLTSSKAAMAHFTGYENL
jgi:hypothetical protein